MNWFNRHIKNKMATLIVITNIIIALFVVSLVQSLKGNLGEYQNILTEEVSYERQSIYLQNHYKTLELAWQKLLELEPEQQQMRSSAWEKFKATHRQLEESARQLVSDFHNDDGISPNIVQLMLAFNTSYQESAKAFEAKYQRLTTGELTGKQRQLFSDNGEMQENLVNLSKALSILSADLSEQLNKSTALRHIIARVSIISVMLLSVFFALWVIQRQLITPINKIAQRIRKMGERDFASPLKIDSQDELGRLAEDLDIARNEVAAAMREIVSASQELQKASHLVNATAKKQENDSNEIKSNLDQSSVAVNEMSATVQEITQNTQNASDAANEADQFAAAGEQVMHQTMQAMSALSEDINHTAQMMDKLETDTSSVGSVLEVIKGIAEQTNLLALNAAIEAARAGEQGRGFAVVADEVRGLAQRTQESTLEIQQIIDTILTSSSEAAKAMRQGVNKSEETAQLTSKAGGVIEDITKAVSAIRDMNIQIATASEEQSVVAEQISKSIVEVSSLADEAYIGANKSSQVADEVETIADKMNLMAIRFKI